MNMNKLTNDEIKEKLREIVNNYRHYPDMITPEVHAKFKNEATPYMQELNSRLLKVWIEAGGSVVADNPLKLEFTSLVKNGI